MPENNKLITIFKQFEEGERNVLNRLMESESNSYLVEAANLSERWLEDKGIVTIIIPNPSISGQKLVKISDDILSAYISYLEMK